MRASTPDSSQPDTVAARLLAKLRRPAAVLCLLLNCASVCRAEAPAAFAVIAGADSAHAALTRNAVAQIFLHKRDYWPGGARAHPVNLPANHPLRDVFSRTILGGAPEQFENYWREMYFHGVLPPHVVASEQAMVLFVRSVPGAIGYISTCVPAQGIAVVLMVGKVPRCTQ